MYQVNGYLKGMKRPFVKKVAAKTENQAKEKVLSLIGSNNGLKRTDIEIKEVKRVA